MTGAHLWQILVTTKVPADQLKTLAYDLYYQKASAEGNAVYAVNTLAPGLGIPPKFAYEALKRATALFSDGTLGGDRKTVLEWLAHDYQKSSPWDAVSPMTKSLVDKIAHNVKVIHEAMAKQAPPSPPAGGKPAQVARPAAAAVVAAKQVVKPAPKTAAPKVQTTQQRSWAPQIIFFVGGTIASFILSFKNARKGSRLSIA